MNTWWIKGVAGKRGCFTWSAMLVAALLAACGPRDESLNQESAWPVPEGAQELTIESRSSQVPLDPSLGKLVRAADRLRSAAVDWTVGTPDGPPETTWGLLVDVTTSPDGTVYALDAFLAEVRIFSKDGQYRESILRTGEGPLEMRSPSGLEWLGPDTLLVHSSSQVRFLTRGPGGFQYEKNIQYSRGMTTVCALDDTVYVRVSSPTLEGTVVKMDTEGHGLGVFGTMAEAADPAVRSQLSMGGLACIPRKGGLLVTFMNEGPLLQAYTTSGSPLWTAHFKEFTLPEIRSREVGGARGLEQTQGQSDRVLSLVSLTEGLLLAQVARVGEAVEEHGRRVRPIRRIDSFVLSADTGAGLYVGSELPQILHATGSKLYGVTSEAERGFLRLHQLRW